MKKYKVLSNYIASCDYQLILNKIIEAKDKRKSLLIAPVASQVLVRAFYDMHFRNMLKSFDYLVPCSEWIKKSINFLYGVDIKKRVYGPELMLEILKIAEEKEYTIFFYGTTQKNLTNLHKKVQKLYPSLIVVGKKHSLFKTLTFQQKKDLVVSVEEKKTDILFVGLGEPLQEEFVYDLVTNIGFKTPLIIITVGAAFDYISGYKSQAPEYLGNNGLEWLYRLLHEPKRLWKRFILLGPLFVLLVFYQKIKMMYYSIFRIPKFSKK